MSNEVPALAKAFPPGYFIREELEFRGWSQRHLASQMGRPLQIVNGIINGHRMITAETATQLQKVFGTSAIYWMNLEAIWQLYRLNEKKKSAAHRKKNRMAHATETYSVPLAPIVTVASRSTSASRQSAPPPGMTGHQMAASNAQVASKFSKARTETTRKPKPKTRKRPPK